MTCYRRSGLALAALLLAAFEPSMAASDLPRKDAASTRTESYPGVVVSYDSFRDDAGRRLRLIVTHPDKAGRFPAIFVVGWLSCDSVEAPPGTSDPTQLVFQHLARLEGFATLRMDKAGAGDSEGDCAATDFLTELAEYRKALRKLADYPFVDTDRVFVLGLSNGGGFAPLVSDGMAVKGYVVAGGWIKTWYEHMLEIERRRLGLRGTPATRINSLMKSVAELYSGYLLDRQAPAQILARRPELAPVWEGDPAHQYGRPVAYYQQLQDLDLMAAWSSVKVPALVLHGQFDWIMSREDPQLTAALVNRNAPGSAEFVELPDTGHSFEHVTSAEAAFAGQTLPFDPTIAERIGAWFEQHRN